MAAKDLKFLTEHDVRSVVSNLDVINTQRAVFPALERGEAALAPRALLPGPEDSTAFAYLARASASSLAVVKMGSITPKNSDVNLPVIHADVLVQDEHGILRTIIDGETITLMRTAAASAVAIETLTARHPKKIGLIGSGPQIREHISMIRELFSDVEFIIYARNPERRAALQSISGVRTVDAADKACTDVDVLLSATNSITPVVNRAWINSAELYISLGSFAPGRCEFDQETLKSATKIIVDDRVTAAKQAGPIAHAVSEGSLSIESLTNLGQLIGNKRTETGFWIYNSVGIGVQDAAMAELVMQRALA